MPGKLLFYKIFNRLHRGNEPAETFDVPEILANSEYEGKSWILTNSRAPEGNIDRDSGGMSSP
jgi:hypothetical protein